MKKLLVLMCVLMLCSCSKKVDVAEVLKERYNRDFEIKSSEEYDGLVDLEQYKDAIVFSISGADFVAYIDDGVVADNFAQGYFDSDICDMIEIVMDTCDLLSYSYEVVYYPTADTYNQDNTIKEYMEGTDSFVSIEVTTSGASEDVAHQIYGASENLRLHGIYFTMDVNSSFSTTYAKDVAPKSYEDILEQL